MQTKTVTLLILLIFLLGIVLSAHSLNTLSRGGVTQVVDDYVGSGHADRESLSFTNWNNNDPPLVPAACATCHSTAGFLDFLGEDGSTPGVVDQAAPVGDVITCIACHNPSISQLDSVPFHSGAQFTPTGSEAACLVCHQSRQSTQGVQSILQGLDDDVVDPDLSFINPHYNFAASTQLGAQARSGYEYPAWQYAGYFAHAEGVETCTDCHNPHNLSVEPQKCAVCHFNVVDRSDFPTIRTQTTDFDGDQDVSEGIYAEITAFDSYLLDAIQGYARLVSGKPVVYGEAFPYFFIDANDNRIADPEEINRDNRYNAWTPRLLKAAYNYQFVQQDSGGYVHNSRYVLQLLHDSIIDLQVHISPASVDLLRP